MKLMDIQTVHKLQLEVLKEVDKICKKNDITYYLYAGTLLGAVRHKGFIPWDDDIDLAMERKEFERFLKACENDLDDRYFLQTFRSDPYFHKSLARVCIPGTYVEEKYSEHIPFNKSLYLDIFVLDRIEENEDERKKHAYAVRRIDKWILLKTGYVYENGFLNYKRISKIIIRKLLSPVPIRFFMERREKLIRKYENTDNEYLCNFQHRPGSYERHLRQVHQVSRFGTPKELEFEGELYPVPNDWDGYLSQNYGDYMKLPPEDQRKADHNTYFL